jgi:multiple sugar transport system substrate-binding protein
MANTTTAAQPTPPQELPGKKTTPPSFPVKRSPFRFVAPLIILLVVLGIGFFIVTRLTGLFSPGSKPGQPVELTYWGLWEPDAVMQPALDAFTAQNPDITVTYVQRKSQDYRELLQTAIQNGTGPDVFRFHHTWTPMLQEDLDTAPSSVISSSDFDAQFYPVAATWLKTNRGIVGIPLMIDGLGLYYNTAIFDAANLAPPDDWEELRRTAKQLTVYQGDAIQRGGVAMGTTGNVEHWPEIIGSMLLQNNADPKNPNNTLGQTALTFYTLLSTSDRVWDETLPPATFAFATEKVTMMLAPSWRAHEVRDINPSLEFAIAPIPQLPDTNITWASFWAEGVNSKSDKAKREAAWKLLAYLNQKETLRDLYARASSAPGRMFGEPFARVDMADQLIGNPFVSAYVTQAPTARSWYLNSYTHDNGVNDQTIKYYEDAINAILTNTPASQALSTTEQGITQVFSRFNLR